MGNRAEVIVSRGTAGPISFGPVDGPKLFLAVLANRGEEDVPTLITSEGDFVNKFGGATRFADGDRYSVGYEVLKHFFAKQGRRCVVSRIVGASAVAALSTLVDRAGAPLDTLTITAKGAGTWGNRIDVTIADGTNADTFKLTVQAYDFDDTTLIDTEVFDNLKMVSGLLNTVNNQSRYVRLTDLASVTAAPANRPANGTYDLGTDGSAATLGVDNNAPAAADIVGTSVSGVKTGLKAFRDGGLGWGWIAAPDLDADALVVSELEAQTEPYFRQYLTSADEGATVATAQTQRAAHDSVEVGFYFPRWRVQDVRTDEIKTIPIVGLVAGVWTRVANEKGPGKNPAGLDFRLTHGLGLETQINGQPLVDSGVAETLLAAGVNPLWDPTGTGNQVMGARSATTETAWLYMNAAYLFNLIGFTAYTNLQQFIYEVADDLFFVNLRLGIRAFMVDLHAKGAFNGSIPGPNEEPDPSIHAFAVEASADLLTPVDIATGNVRVKIWYRPAGTAETILTEVAKQNEV